MSLKDRFDKLRHEASERYMKTTSNIAELELAEALHHFSEHDFSAYNPDSDNKFFRFENSKSLQDAIALVKDLAQKLPALQAKHEVIQFLHENSVTIMFLWDFKTYKVCVYFSNMSGCRVLEKSSQTKIVKELELHPECQALIRDNT